MWRLKILITGSVKNRFTVRYSKVYSYIIYYIIYHINNCKPFRPTLYLRWLYFSIDLQSQGNPIKILAAFPAP